MRTWFLQKKLLLANILYICLLISIVYPLYFLLSSFYCEAKKFILLSKKKLFYFPSSYSVFNKDIFCCCYCWIMLQSKYIYLCVVFVQNYMQDVCGKFNLRMKPYLLSVPFEDVNQTKWRQPVFIMINWWRKEIFHTRKPFKWIITLLFLIKGSFFSSNRILQ